MVEVDLVYDASTPVSLVADLVPTSASLSVKKPDGTQLEAPAVAISAVNTTTAAGTTKNVLTLVAVTGIVPGTPLLVTSDGVTYACEAAVVDATAKTVQLVQGLPVVPDTGSAVKGCKLTATVAAPGVANIGADFRLAWTYADAASTRRVGVPAAVVRWPWTSPVTASGVRDIVNEMRAGPRSEQWSQDVADQVNDVIRGRLNQVARRPWLYLSSAVFADVGRRGVRFELAQRGICLGGQIYEAQRETRFAFEDGLTQAITGLAAYDRDKDGAISAAEAKPRHFSLRAVR